MNRKTCEFRAKNKLISELCSSQTSLIIDYKPQLYQMYCIAVLVFFQYRFFFVAINKNVAQCEIYSSNEFYFRYTFL